MNHLLHVYLVFVSGVLATVVAISGVGWGAATTLTCLRSVRYRWYAVRICARYGCYVDHGVGLGWGRYFALSTIEDGNSSMLPILSGF